MLDQIIFFLPSYLNLKFNSFILNIFIYFKFIFFKNGETKIQVKVQPSIETELNLSKEDSLLTHTKTPANEIEEFVNGDLCLYGVSLI